MSYPTKTLLPPNSTRTLQLTAGGAIQIEAASADGSNAALPRFQMVA